jgi:hypothetical protein
MEGKLTKDEFGYWLDISNDGITKSPLNDFGQLSIKNCQAIENGYDLDELVNKFTENFNTFHVVKSDIQVGYKEGFQKALEIKSDKKFSEDDMIKFMQFTISIEELGNTSSVSTSTAKYYLDNFTSNLQQNEWEVDIEMEEKRIGGIKGYGEYEIVPKLDADGCLILIKK